MVDPTSDLGEDVDEGSAPRCASCDDPVLGPDHRVVTWVGDGEARSRHFCDEDCLDQWDDERPDA